MSELDFDREGFPYVPRVKAFPVHPEDEFARSTVLPLMRQLDSAQQTVFDSALVRSYSPETPNATHEAAMQVLRRLPLDELVEVSSMLGFMLEPR